MMPGRRRVVRDRLRADAVYRVSTLRARKFWRVILPRAPGYACCSEPGPAAIASRRNGSAHVGRNRDGSGHGAARQVWPLAARSTTLANTSTVNVRCLSEHGLDSHAGGTVPEKECRFSCADWSDGIEASIECRKFRTAIQFSQDIGAMNALFAKADGKGLIRRLPALRRDGYRRGSSGTRRRCSGRWPAKISGRELARGGAPLRRGGDEGDARRPA